MHHLDFFCVGSLKKNIKHGLFNSELPLVKIIALFCITTHCETTNMQNSVPTYFRVSFGTKFEGRKESCNDS